MSEQKAINASDIVENPDLIHSFNSAYILLRDSSMVGTYKNMLGALNILADDGWEAAEMTVDTGTMYLLCRNPHFKRKQRPGPAPEEA
ncbi:MAG: hypothetical protein MUE40_02915 [Anaerolineae bacterium]|jgi:hypothetical protein|nr:hypothetical protein [Anaerolineae bacterium]